MGGQRWRAIGAVCAAMVLMDVINVNFAVSDDAMIFLLPGGLLAGAVALATPNRRVLVAVLGAVVTAVPLLLMRGGPDDVVLQAIAIAVAALVVVRSLRPETWPGDGPAVVEVLKFLSSCVAGALAAAAVTGVLQPFTAGGIVWWRASMGMALTELLRLVVIVPFFLPAVRGQARIASRWFEQQARWLALIAISGLMVSGLEVPNCAMLLLPVLVWTALRARIWEICAQIIWVDAVVLLALALDPDSVAVVTGANRNGALEIFAPHIFVLACAIATIPFAMMVALERRSAARAEATLSWHTQLLDSVRGIAIIGIDAGGRIDTFNPGAEDILGYRAAEVVGKLPGIFQTESEVRRLAKEFGCAPTYDAVVRAVRERSAGEAVDIEYIRGDGMRRILATVLQPVLGPDRETLGWVVTAEDVTQRVMTQHALEEGLRIESRATERMREVERARDSFVSSVSHEIRTPLTNIAGYLELLMDSSFGDITGVQRDVLARMDVNGKRLLDLVGDLDTMSGVDNVAGAVELVEVDLCEVVLGAEEIFSPALFPRNLEVRVEVPAEPLVIMGDRRLLEQMITNLARNAIKFTLDGGLVVVSLTGTSERWELAVSDTGIGIPADEQKFLFQRFYRASTARDAAIQGTGLGLPIALAIAELHGMTITVESMVEVGTTFAVVPRSAAPAAQEA